MNGAVVRSWGIAAALLVLAGLGREGLAAPARTEAAFREACDLYERGDFQAALDGFEAIRSGGIRNAAVYFNLGNCYYRQDEIGRSIANYKRALLLAPRDGDIRANLRLARATVVGGDSSVTQPPGPGDLSLSIASPRQSQALFYAAYYLAAAFLLGALFLEDRLRRTALYGLAVAVVVAGAAFGLSRYGASRLTSSGEAVVVADGAELKSGPGTAFEDLAGLSDGVEVKLRARSGMWVEVQLATGEIGWLAEKDPQTI